MATCTVLVSFDNLENSELDSVEEKVRAVLTDRNPFPNSTVTDVTEEDREEDTTNESGVEPETV